VLSFIVAVSDRESRGTASDSDAFVHTDESLCFAQKIISSRPIAEALVRACAAFLHWG